MDQQNIKCEIQALWLQYFGLRNESAGSSNWIENAARIPETQRMAEELPEFPGLIIAT